MPAKKKRGRPKGAHTPWTESFRDRVLRKYPDIDRYLGNASIPMREIAERYGINRESVRRMEKGLGLTPRRKQEKPPSKRIKTNWSELSAGIILVHRVKKKKL